MSKTVQEMKSLQLAIELYNDKYGIFPGISNPVQYDDDAYGHGILSWNGYDSMDTLFRDTLVDNNFISEVPHAPNYPNNCVGDCPTNGYILGYLVHDMLYSYGVDLFTNNQNTYYYTCGEKKVENYLIFFYTNSKTLNLPVLQYYDGYPIEIMSNLTTGWSGNIYCLAG